MYGPVKLVFRTKLLTLSENRKLSLEALRAKQSIHGAVREPTEAKSILTVNCCWSS